ncbi:MAG: hypothetical protein IJS60_05425 [Abditibacteriota bacterium]|nr:hypothetical protein [Abditibacteriota bacterium]
MKKKVSLFILFILLFITIYNLGSILFFNKYFINNYDIENKIFDKSSNIYSFIPNMRLHISDKNQSLNNAIKLNLEEELIGNSYPRAIYSGICE